VERWDRINTWKRLRCLFSSQNYSFITRRQFRHPVRPPLFLTAAVRAIVTFSSGLVLLAQQFDLHPSCLGKLYVCHQNRHPFPPTLASPKLAGPFLQHYRNYDSSDWASLRSFSYRRKFSWWFLCPPVRVSKYGGWWKHIVCRTNPDRMVPTPWISQF